MPLNLTSKRILVTGGSRGIGAATVRLLAGLGARVAFTYLRAEQAALDLQADLQAQGRDVLAIRADQRRRADAQVAVAAVEATWGGLDAFVGNAGIWAATPADLEDEGMLQDILETNVTGLFRWNAEIIPALRRSGGGSIVLLSSTAGQRGEARHGAYAASKGAVISLVKSLAPELGPDGIRVNAVAPGWVDTDMSAAALRADADQRRRIEAIFPLGRIPAAEDLAGPVAFLLSPWAEAITGEVLNVNGGTVLCG